MALKLTSTDDTSRTDEANPYWISFSDIMAGLLIVFVLATLALILELTQTRMEVNQALIELAQAEQVRRDILREVEAELLQKNIPVEVSDNETVLRIPDNLLTFESNEYVLPRSAGIRDNVKVIGETLYSAITRDERWRYLDTIFVEGHTDIRTSPRNMGNWGLSTFRAITVWNYWNATQPEDERLGLLVNRSGVPLFSVSGYAETRPVLAEQRTEEDFQRNRRIDVRFTVRRPALEDLEAIQKVLTDGRTTDAVSGRDAARAAGGEL
ncbi:MAG: flagellar motor protein MotB [Rhodothermales bacterium]